MDISDNACTGFDGHQRIASGSLQAVALMVKQALDNGAVGPVLIFDDETGKLMDVDLRGSAEELVARLSQSSPIEDRAESSDSQDESEDKARNRGRPKLGVVAREVTLLPRHWAWLATQPGGASVTLRRLVEEARHTNSSKDRIRNAQNRAYNFLSALAGDMPGFEEASRALFANDQSRFCELAAAWPDDVRDHAVWLAFGTADSSTSEKK